MELERLAQYISVQVPTAWESCYEAAMAQYRSNWLDDYDFEYILDYYGFSEEFYKPRLRQEVALLKQDATLNRICWLMHYVLFYGETADFLNTWSWGKGSAKPFAEHGSPTTCVVAALTGQAIHAKNMAERGYDEEQIQIHKDGVRTCWVGQRVNRNLVTFVDMTHILRFVLVVGDLNAVANKLVGLSKQLGIDVESGFEAVFVEYFNKPHILRYAIIVAEGEGFHFSVEHNYLP